MAQEAGTNVLLQVNAGTGSPTNFVTVAGQQNTELVLDTETDDITDKAQAGWGSTIATLKRATVNVQGKAVWPDANGLEQLRVAHDARGKIEAKLILNAAGANYFGFFYVTSLNISGTHQNATEYSVVLQNAEPLNYAAS